MRSNPKEPARQVRRGLREKVLSLKACIAALARTHGARSVRLFGSAARGTERPGSDIDFLIEFDSDCSLIDVIGLENNLADLFGRKVEVVPLSCAKPSFLANVLEDAIRIV